MSGDRLIRSRPAVVCAVAERAAVAGYIQI